MNQNNSPIDIARQTLLQLSKRNQLPTPENYLSVYNEIAGIKTIDSTRGLGSTLQKVLLDAGKQQPKFIAIERSVTSFVEKQDWIKLEEQLRKLFPSGGEGGTEVNWSVLIRTLLKQLEMGHKGITLSRKREGLSRVLTNFASDPTILGEKIQALIRSWGNEATYTLDAKDSPPEVMANAAVSQLQKTSLVTTTPQNLTPNNTEAITAQWREMMLKTVELVLIPHLESSPEAQKKAQTLLNQMRKASSEEVLIQTTKDLKNVLLALEMQRDSQQTINNSLFSLLRLLTKSMGELVIEDQWLKGQIAIVNDIVNKPVSVNTLYDAESSLKELIHKQTNLKPALEDAKNLLKQMAATFINRLVEITESTTEYHEKIETHQKKLSSIDEIGELNDVLKSILDDTRTIGLSVQRTREEFHESQKKVTEAEQKIQTLTAVLDHISEVAHEDYLTGTLNRRGMDEALVREFNRADRYNTSLSIAMMDIDHFKKLNDKLGHTTGDEALTHFAKIVKNVKRSTDVLARYGGEEFIIILPATAQDDAIKVIQRVQRELTKNFFMHQDDRVLITFSAGVAERLPGEAAESVVPRADAALYEAKNTGRNRVVGAPHPLQAKLA
jgi:diguanylate cyclase